MKILGNPNVNFWEVSIVMLNTVELCMHRCYYRTYTLTSYYRSGSLVFLISNDAKSFRKANKIIIIINISYTCTN